MQPAIERFLDISRQYLLVNQLASSRQDAGSDGQEEMQMKAMEERIKHGLARRMKEVVANPPQRTFARELLARGMTANEVWQLVMHDPAFVRVPEAFRIAVANAAREMAAEQLLAARKRPPATDRRNA
jgi:hypothetical protein